VGARGNVGVVDFRFYASTDSVLDEWRDGSFDLLQVSHVRDVGALGDTIVETLPGTSTHYLGFRGDEGPFESEPLRRAVSVALDPVAIAERAGLARPALGGIIPPAIPGHSPRMARSRDLEAARRLLDDAGYANGRGLGTIRLLVPAWLDAGGVVRDQLAEIGLDIEIVAQAVKPLRLMGALREHDAQLWISGWTADYPDPDGFLRGMLETGHLLLRVDADIRGLLQRARAVADQDERLRLYHQIDRQIVAERAVAVPLGYGRTTLLRRPGLEGLSLNPVSLMQVDRVVK
jgi:ABC-type transport system substrate-binding protein